MNDFEIRECLISGWPPGDLGVAVTRYGALLRAGLSEAQKERAIAWAYERWLARYSPGNLQSGAFPINGCSSDIEEGSCPDSVGELNP